jgi:polysaccharide biosynthesis/export protein VpsN
MTKHLFFILILSLCGIGQTDAQVRSDYKVVPFDIIIIDVFGEKDLSREFRVSATGTINYYFLGEVQVAGKTTSEVREKLTEDLNRDYLVEPQVTVDVKTYRSREVIVIGQVTKPGSVLLEGELEMDIIEALGKAGGFTARAHRGKITFTRPGERPRTFDYDELVKMDRDKRIKVQSGDVIDVGEKLL